MAADYPIRSLTDDDFAAAWAVAEHAFNSTWPAEAAMDIERPVFAESRSLAAFDGGQMVGTAMALPFQMTVPGGRATATAGVTGVAVLPTHRRRGILSALMTRQLADTAARGEPVAALFASESGIYGRYGYGMATEHRRFVIMRGEGQLPAAESPGLRLTLADPAAAVKELTAVYDAVRAGRPGMMSRSEAMWTATLADPEFVRHGDGPQRCLIAADAGGPRGYALYSGKPEWGEDALSAHELHVRELFGTDLAAYTALWADLLSRDLVGQVRAYQRPADDPLQFLLPDRRRTRSYVTDGLWVRLVDLAAAMALRRYSCPVDVVVEIDDQLVPANAGRWRLRAGQPADPAAASCERTTAAADLAMPVTMLGAAYLGGTRIGALAAAGQVTELRPGAVAALSAAMGADPAPCCPAMF